MNHFFTFSPKIGMKDENQKKSFIFFMFPTKFIIFLTKFIERKVLFLAKIFVDENESIDQAIKRFRKRCERDGIKRELKKRAFYEKPSMQKKRKKEQAKRKELKRLRKFQQKGYRK